MNQALNLELNKPGFWGKHTSSINWCEPDYQHSFLIAETFNTISNSFYLLGSLLFLFQLRSLLYSSKQSLPKRWYSLPLSGALVGVGSWMFHMTLRYPFQVMDELSMLIGMLCVIFCCLTYDDYKHQAMDQLKISQLPEGVEKNRQEAYHFVLTFFNQFNSIRSMLIMISCVISFAFLLSVYDPMEPLVFQSMFGILTFIMLIMVYRQSYYYTTRFPAYNNKNKTKGLDETRCAIALESVNMHAAAKKRTLRFSIVCILLSALVWNMDNLTCPRFEFLKLHSLWHLFTAMACYYLSPLLLLSYYGDRYDEWMYEMLTKQSEQRSPWTNAQVEPMNVKLTWRFLLFPVIVVLPSLRDKQKKKE